MGQRLDVTGYADRWSLASGQSARIAVSARCPTYYANLYRHRGAIRAPEDWLQKAERFPFPQSGAHNGHARSIELGSYFEADFQLPLENKPVFVEFWLNISLLVQDTPLIDLALKTQSLNFRISSDGALYVAGNDQPDSATSPNLALDVSRWTKLSVWYDGAGGALKVTARHLNGQTTSCEWRIPKAVQPEILTGILIGAATGKNGPKAGFNGKIAGPKLLLAKDKEPQTLIADWCFDGADQSSFYVKDRCDTMPVAKLCNAPTRCTPGPYWTGGTENLDAVAFHEDDLDDCDWPADFEMHLPEGMPSGVYSLVLSRDETPVWTDRCSYHALPIFVRPKSAPNPAIALVLPSFSYRAYANATAFEDCDPHVFKLAQETVSQPDYRTAAYYGLHSLYDRHSDGSGVHLVSLKRPQMNIQADFVSPLQGFAHQFSADLEIVEWLEREGFAFDVLTDEALHERGADALMPYDVVLTGSHPEYASPQVFTAYDRYLCDGGALAYLGGNGFYWSAAVSAHDPALMEVRRSTATRTWSCAPGETVHQLDGQKGGAWRYLDRPPNLLTGLGFSCLGFSGDGAYQVNPSAAADLPPNLADAVAGLRDQPFGVAGLELDRYDLRLGSDPGLTVIASTNRLPDGYHPGIEEVDALDNLLPDPISAMQQRVRGDIVFGERDRGGFVFSVGSIRWTSALNVPGDPQKVAAITKAALQDLLASVADRLQRNVR